MCGSQDERIGGEKRGFGRTTFMTAVTQSGIPAALAERMIDRMVVHLPEWKELIRQSFLPDKMKAGYCELLEKRKVVLTQIGLKTDFGINMR